MKDYLYQTSRILTCSALLLTGSVKAESTQDVIIHMDSKVDHNCDTIPESGTKVRPSGCIIYYVTVENNSETIVNNAKITTFIPEHTTLFSNIEVVEGNAITTSGSQSSDEDKLITELSTLQPGTDNQVVLRYSVKVM